MDSMLYNILACIIGAILLDFVYTRYIRGLFRNEDKELTGTISTDDIMQHDDISDQNFIPVRIIYKSGIYYGWFSGNERFIGQSTVIDEIQNMAYSVICKQLGLRLVITEEFGDPSGDHIKPISTP
jgi:hypothetical protein